MENTGKIATALLSAQREMGLAIKDSQNPFYKSKYADLNSIREACMPSLNKYGIVVLQPTIVQDGKNYVKTLLLHESGESMECITEIIFDKQNNAQAQGSGISYARRYGLQSFVNIGAEDDDGTKVVEKKTKKVLAADKIESVNKALESEKTTKEFLLENYTISKEILDKLKFKPDDNRQFLTHV